MTTKGELLKVIRSMCLRCTAGSDIEIKNCTSNVQPFKEYITCPLYPYRMGKDPKPSKNKGFARIHAVKKENNEVVQQER